jgi:hypothetical protein
MALSTDSLILALYGSGLLLLGFMLGYAAGSYRSLYRGRSHPHLR